MQNIIWTEYLRFRAQFRGFDLQTLERIIRGSGERYIDTVAERLIVVGRHKGQMVMIPYDVRDDTIIPVTVHATTPQQINFR